MESKVQEISEKIYREGVEKGQAEAQKLVEQAKAQQDELLKEAKQEAEKIISAARKQAKELDCNTRSELSLYAMRMMETLKSEIVRLVSDSVVRAAVKETVTGEWLQQWMLQLAAEWSQKEKIVIQAADAEMLKQYFVRHAKSLLDKGVTITQAGGKTASFTVVPAGGGYKVEFGEEEFAAFFKDFLRPQLAEWLFGQN
jgi:V/A-type H+-transporting ATPase subunit E